MLRTQQEHTKNKQLNVISLRKIFLLVTIQLLFCSCKEEQKIILSYHENGAPQAVLYLKKPVTADSLGRKIIYRPDGKTQCAGGYMNGLRHGDWECFYPNGRLEWKAHFIDGKEEGELLCYSEDGAWKKSYTIAGVLDGPSVEYNVDESGYAYYVYGKYKDGLEIGIWTTTDTSGHKVIEETYVDGKVFGECKTYYSNGYIQTRGTCINKNFVDQGADSYSEVTMTDTLWYYSEHEEGKVDSFKVLN